MLALLCSHDPHAALTLNVSCGPGSDLRPSERAHPRRHRDKRRPVCDHHAAKTRRGWARLAVLARRPSRPGTAPFGELILALGRYVGHASMVRNVGLGTFCGSTAAIGASASEQCATGCCGVRSAGRCVGAGDGLAHVLRPERSIGQGRAHDRKEGKTVFRSEQSRGR